MSVLERVYAFHQDLRNQRYPNARDLAARFEVSLATARRDISYLRDRLLAPIVFDQKKNGFYYRDEGFALPFEQSPRILLLLSLLNKLAEEAGLVDLPELKRLENRLGALLVPGHSRLVDSLYCEFVEVEPVEPAVFEAILEAMAQGRMLRFQYRSARGELSERRAGPLRLVNYQGRWYLFAWCELRQAHRLFHLARISAVVPDTDTNQYDLPASDSYLAQSFGIFKGDVLYEAELLFTGTAAELVRHQRWHRDQRLIERPDGLLLRLPVSDDREVMMKVLQYGAMARVVGPEHLRLGVAREIMAMNELYQEDRKSD
ncbi:MAG: WYL domain-containing transcriptional regulator [Desulfobulbaceae bacterium]|uniref:WYL domain-containing transcriptional regulator n=1 Tax=Candidatus Desulfatifera sulfidica TaxID=2841691 RepID=A0A8J6NA83_9BACT|nr:WYL domain-containing transcriptional regulator [Candidatus Desulfatifera sulfidica]